MMWGRGQVNTTDIGGVQSLIAMIYLGTVFPGVVNMNTAMTHVFEMRAVYYR